jgi:capsular polysaccharide biosynthesis protein
MIDYAVLNVLIAFFSGVLLTIFILFIGYLMGQAKK